MGRKKMEFNATVSLAYVIKTIFSGIMQSRSEFMASLKEKNGGDNYKKINYNSLYRVNSFQIIRSRIWYLLIHEICNTHIMFIIIIVIVRIASISPVYTFNYKVNILQKGFPFF